MPALLGISVQLVLVALSSLRKEAGQKIDLRLGQTRTQAKADTPFLSAKTPDASLSRNSPTCTTFLMVLFAFSAS